MNRVDDNDIIRDSTPDEDVFVGKMGGGTDRFELIRSIVIDSPINNKKYEIKPSDEVFIKFVGEGNTTSNLWLRIWSGNNYTHYSIANFFSTDLRIEYIRIYRLSPSCFEINTGGQIKSTQIIEFTDISKYDQKIEAITFGISIGENKINNAQIEIYGRKLTYESD